MDQHRPALTLATALILCLAADQVAAHRLLEDSSSNSKPPAMCSTSTTTHTILQGDTPRKIVTAVYPNSAVPWRKLWGIIKACNKAALGMPGTVQLPANTILIIPAIPARLINKPDDKPKDDSEDPVIKALCGCGPRIPVTKDSSWLELVTAAYPELQPAAFAANILAMCNRRASFVDGSDKKMVKAGQELRSICTSIKGKSFQDFLNEADLQAEKVKADVAASQGAAAAAPDTAAAVVLPDDVGVAQAGICTINTGTSTAAVRPVYLANDCPVYTNGCSGPSDTLSYQQQLTPCCQAHDWCYSCAHKVGWTGDTGRANCDITFRNNLYAACDMNYGTWDPNRGLCKTTADAMYTAVRLGGESAFVADVCPDESWKLAATSYCFNPLYQSPGVVSIRTGNGQQWGSWTNWAQCPVGSWMNGFSARVQSAQGFWYDDTALNAVRATCSNEVGTQTAAGLIPSGGGGQTGSWQGYSTCPPGRHITAMRLQVEGSQGPADDTAANTLKVRCSDGTTELSHSSPGWGGWSGWVSCPVGTAVCAFKVKIEQPGAADPTALNDIELACCRK